MGKQVLAPLDFAEIAAPATPTSGVRVYAKSDHKLYIKDTTGAEVDLTATGGSSGGPLATAITNTSANTIYPDGATYWKHVVTTDAFPANGFLSGFRSGTVHTQRLQDEITGSTFARYWIDGSTAWSAWVLYIDAQDYDLKGDLLVGTGSDTWARLPLGTNGQVLLADSAQTTGLRWAWPAAVVQTKTANYTALSLDNLVLANAVAGAFTITLPAVAAGQQLIVKKIDSSVFAVTVVPASGTIDGASSVVLVNQWQSRTFVSDGTNWFMV